MSYIMKMSRPGYPTITFNHIGEVRAYQLCLLEAQKKAEQAEAVKRVEYWTALTFCEKLLEYSDRKPSAEDYRIAEADAREKFNNFGRWRSRSMQAQRERINLY